jgi:hypothetical protein
MGRSAQKKSHLGRSNSIGNPMQLHLVAGGIIQAPDMDRPMRYSNGGEYVPIDLKECYSSFNQD